MLLLVQILKPLNYVAFSANSSAIHFFFLHFVQVHRCFVSYIDSSVLYSVIFSRMHKPVLEIVHYL